MQKACEGTADINALDARGDTPLILATRLGDIRAAAILVACGADVTIKNSKGNDAGFYAQKYIDKYPDFLNILSNPRAATLYLQKQFHQTILENEQKVSATIAALEAKATVMAESQLTLCEQGFRDAFNEFMSAKIHVCAALFKEEVEKKRDAWDKADQLIKNLEPAITKNIQSSPGALLGITATNLLTSYILELRKEKSKARAEHVIRVFKNGEFINKTLLDELSTALINRFKDQINQLTVTTREEKVVLTANDGVVILAKRIASRMILHVMKNVDAMIEVENNKQTKKPLFQCIEAIYKCKSDGLIAIEYLPRLAKYEKQDAIRLGLSSNAEVRWNVADLLEKTGIKCVNTIAVLYTRSSIWKSRQSAHSIYGFCTASEDEARARGFDIDKNVNDPFQVLVKSASSTKLMTGTGHGLFATSRTEPSRSASTSTNGTSVKAAAPTEKTNLLDESKKSSKSGCCVIS